MRCLECRWRITWISLVLRFSKRLDEQAAEEVSGEGDAAAAAASLENDGQEEEDEQPAPVPGNGYIKCSGCG